MSDPKTLYPAPPFPRQSQSQPGRTLKMDPVPDHGETSWKGHGRLQGKIAVITGGDSGIGRAVAIAYAREGCSLLIGCLDETEDAEDTVRVLRAEGVAAELMASDLSTREGCEALIARAAELYGQIDILVNNAAWQEHFERLEDIPPRAWSQAFAVNVSAVFHLVQEALPLMKPGACVINTASINSDAPNPGLLPYACTKGALHNLTAGLAGLLAERGIRVNCVAPGPVWTPLIPATLPEEDVMSFGKDYPLGRPAQPAELAAPYVMLAEDTASYISGATIAVTGGKPFL
ncbi:SDR family oxidoreductase [Falsigemmobacter intermedius]|uniref:SDR family oxidoreductase n=1 Tax=Falsigemmobacter intermedius TaxID=1553448 RepID=UPI003F04B5D7